MMSIAPQTLLERLETAGKYADLPYIQDAIYDAAEEIKRLREELDGASAALKDWWD